MGLIGRYEDGSRNPGLDARRPAADHYIIGAHSPLAELKKGRRNASRLATRSARFGLKLSRLQSSKMGSLKAFRLRREGSAEGCRCGKRPQNPRRVIWFLSCGSVADHTNRAVRRAPPDLNTGLRAPIGGAIAPRLLTPQIQMAGPWERRERTRGEPLAKIGRVSPDISVRGTRHLQATDVGQNGTAFFEKWGSGPASSSEYITRRGRTSVLANRLNRRDRVKSTVLFISRVNPRQHWGRLPQC